MMSHNCAPNLELRFILGFTRRLPKVKGARRIAKLLRRFYLRKRRAPVQVEVLGAAMSLDPNEAVDGRFLFEPQLYDYHEIDFMRRNLCSGDVFLDVGAHIGFYTMMASRMVGAEGVVLAIEADPFNCQRLSYNLNLNGIANVRPLNVGVSDIEDVLQLSINSTGNRSANTFLSQGTGTRIDVHCYPLAALLAQHKIAEVAGAKLDIEGFEWRVLDRFFADVAQRLYPRFLIIEHQPVWVEKAGGNAIQLLLTKGYEVHWSSGLNYIMVLR
jgi:FkbM family methyltransferase